MSYKNANLIDHFFWQILFDLSISGGMHTGKVL